MSRISTDLHSIKQSHFKYLFPLVLFVVVYPAFHISEVHFFFQAAFIFGLIIFSISYDRLEKELNRVKMKNHYLKSKINMKIEELNSSIDKSNKAASTELLQSIINEME